MRLNFFFYCFITLAISSCGQIPDPLRNNIEFADNINQVADSILRMEDLLKKTPKQPVLSSFTDNEGFLFVNGKRLGLLKNAVNDSSIRSAPVFIKFSNDDYVKFISISIFLLKNYIGYSMRDNVSGLFVHGYRETKENSYDDMREIMVGVDTTAPVFVKRYQILDRKENVILVAPIDARVY